MKKLWLNYMLLVINLWKIYLYVLYIVSEFEINFIGSNDNFFICKVYCGVFVF